MSSEARARGTLHFASARALDEVLALLEGDEDDDDLAAVRDAVRDGSRRDGLAFELELDVHLSNAANLELQEWLGDLAEAAERGHVDTWQEAFGDELYVRVLAGGEEQELAGPFPPRSTDDRS